MSSNNGSDADRERRLDEAVAQYLECRAAGQVPDRQQWLTQYPDLADDLAEFLQDLDHVQAAVKPLRELESEPAATEWELPTSSVLGGGRVQVNSSIHPPRLNRVPAGRYRRRQFRARGGMGEVWLAEDAHVGRQIAVKMLRQDRAGLADQTLQERFLFEAQVMGQLEHPCIVPLHDLGRDEAGELFCVMKLVDGCTLKERLEIFHATKTRANWVRQVEFLRLLESFVSICRAAAYAHSRGVLHRDIKPDNIMLGSYGEAMLLDWGLSKVVNQPDVVADSPLGRSAVRLSSGSSAATQDGVVLGSPAYMPPELAAGRSDTADQTTDVYLLGATLYEILVGRPPRAGGSRLELLDLAQTTPPTPPRRIDPHIPRALEAICLKAMAHGRDQRYPSATALSDDIEQFLVNEPVTAHREPLAMRVWRWCRRHRRSIQRVLVFILILACFGVAWNSYGRARVLAQREVARQQLAEFRLLADEAQYYAASIDPVTERAPYFHPQHAMQVGYAALEITEQWGNKGERLPLVEERGAVSNELYDLLLVLANVHEQSDSSPTGPSRALSLLDRASALRAPSRGYHQIRARCLKRVGRAADADLELAIAQSSRTAATAQDYFLQGEIARMDSGYRDGGAHEPSQSPSRKAAILDSIAAYREAIRLDPQGYWAQFQLGRCYLGLQRGPESVGALGTCIAMRPTAPWAYSTRGLAYGLLGQFEEAQDDLAQALRLDPDFRPARLNRGFVHYLQKQEVEAMTDLEAALRPPADRQLIEAAYYRAQMHYERSRLDAALRDCELVLEHKPDFVPALQLQARIHFRTGNEVRGLESLNALLSATRRPGHNRQESEAQVRRGHALREIAMDLDPAARKRLLLLALAEFESADLPREAAAIHELLGNATEAIEAYSLQLDVTSHDSATRVKRAWNYVALKRYDLAAADFQKVLAQIPDDPEAHSGLGYVLAMQGDREASEHAAAQAVLYGGSGYLVLHNVACIYAELARSNISQRAPYDDLAVKLLERAVALFRQRPDGPDEIELIRGEAAFDDTLRSRPEFKRLLGSY